VEPPDGNSGIQCIVADGHRTDRTGTGRTGRISQCPRTGAHPRGGKGEFQGANVDYISRFPAARSTSLNLDAQVSRHYIAPSRPHTHSTMCSTMCSVS
jgi:hypothetical protein